MEPALAPYIMDASNIAIEKAQALLGGILRVTLSDGRVFEGLFSCLDKSFNIVLNNACELTETGIKKAPFNPRVGGVVIVPGKHVVKCEAAAVVQATI